MSGALDSVPVPALLGGETWTCQSPRVSSAPLFAICTWASWASLVAQAGKESACSVGDLGSIPGFRRSPGEGKGQYSGMENSMDYIVHEVAKSGT